MQYGIILTRGTPREQVELARLAEVSGWDGVFTFDAIHIGDESEMHDPWALLGAFATATSRVRLGAIVHPLPRLLPWEVARRSTTVDQLSNGRLVLPVGLGALDDSGFGAVGQPTDRHVRAERLDESLAILEGLWSGEPFGFEGAHFGFPPMAFRPRPVQRPRIPVWVVAAWPRERSLARALRFDGLLPNVVAEDGRQASLTPAIVAEIREWVAARRSLEGFDIVAEGTTPADDAGGAAATVRDWAEAGATWWTEADWSGGSVETLRGRIAAGPPRLVAADGAPAR